MYTTVRIPKEYHEKLYDLAYALWKLGRIEAPKVGLVFKYLVDRAYEEVMSSGAVQLSRKEES